MSTSESNPSNPEMEVAHLLGQLNYERQKVQALLQEKDDLEKSRLFRLTRLLWQIRLKLIPNESWLAQRLHLGRQSKLPIQLEQPLLQGQVVGQEPISAVEVADSFTIAKQLNSQLYDPVNAIPPDDLHRIWSSMEHILIDKYKVNQADLKAWYWHRYRLYLTNKELEIILPLFDTPPRVLEMGTENPFSDVIRQNFPGIDWQNTVGDLRYAWEFPDGCIDLVFSTEVLEHLQDFPKDFQEVFEGTGLDAALKECFRVLRPGGRLFFTTPNGASIWHLRNCLLGREPWFANVHIHEYTLMELSARVEAAGFIVEKVKSVHCMTIDHQVDYTPLFQLLVEYQFNTNTRGDDFFFLARKPENSSE